MPLEITAAQHRTVAVQEQGGGATQAAAARDDRDGMHHLRATARGGNNRVRRFMHGDRVPLTFGQHVSELTRAGSGPIEGDGNLVA